MLAPATRRYAPREWAALPGHGIDGYVQPLKRLLPWLTAVLIGFILFLAASKTAEFSFVLKRNEVMTSQERLRLERGVYRGLDKQGRPFTVRADEAVQRSSSVPIVNMRGINAQLQMARGPANVVAETGAYDMEKDLLTLNGPVRAAEGNYRLDTGRAVLDINKQVVTSLGPVTGRSGLGTFRAAGMIADIENGTVQLTGGVHLRITDPHAKVGA